MPIFRLFNSIEDATEAAQELKKSGIGRVGIRLLEHTEDGVDLDTMQQAGASGTQAKQFAKRMEDGAKLMIVDAPFGTAATVLDVLEKTRSQDTGVFQAIEARAQGPAHDDAAPLSSKLGYRVLWDNPTPLSSYFGWPLLSKRQRPQSTLGLPLLSDTAAPLSSWTRLPTLSSNAAPLSSLTKAPVLSPQPTPLSSAAKVPVLWGDAAPLSSRVGFKTIWHSPTPLSSLLGLAVLSGRTTQR